MLRPKLRIEKLMPARHGGIDYLEMQKLGKSPAEVLDFSVSTNPYGPPPGLRQALAEVSIDRYPDSDSTELKSQLAEKLGISPANLVVGSGSTELIRLVTIAYFGLGAPVLILQPTYGEYELSCRIVGAKLIKPPINENEGLQLYPPEIADITQQYHPKGIFLCNPNNPTGQYLTKSGVEQILSAARDSLVILDEAYLAFTDNTWSPIDLIGGNNLFIVRSMTKDYALAGLRLGYGIAGEHIITTLNKVKPPWNVSSIAQKAGIYVLNDEQYLETCRTKIKESKSFLIEALEKLGLNPLPSYTNFFLVKVGDATAFRQALVKKGILVRDCTSFGLPAYIRLATRPIDECQKLIAAIKEIGV